MTEEERKGSVLSPRTTKFDARSTQQTQTTIYDTRVSQRYYELDHTEELSSQLRSDKCLIPRLYSVNNSQPFHVNVQHSIGSARVAKTRKHAIMYALLDFNTQKVK